MRIEIEQAISTQIHLPDLESSDRTVKVLFGETVIFETTVEEGDPLAYYDDDDLEKEALTQVGEKLKQLLDTLP